MTNKPMLSVERELLEELRNVCGDPDLAEKANALLDKPVTTDFESWWAETGEQLTKHEIGLKDLMRCAYESKPDTQRQVEPVLIQAVAVTRGDDEEGLRIEWLLEGGISEMGFPGMTLFALPEANNLCDEDGSAEIYLSPQCAEQPAPVGEVVHVSEDQIRIGLYDEYSLKVGDLIYTEQPAPVSTGTASDKYKAELYDEVWKKARELGYNNVTDALSVTTKRR